MYGPMLMLERHTGCLLAARLRPGKASSHARIVPMLVRLVPRLQSPFFGVEIKLLLVVPAERSKSFPQVATPNGP
jgi:hypothetical protein